MQEEHTGNKTPWFGPYSVAGGEGSIVRSMVQDWVNDTAAGRLAPLDPRDRKFAPARVNAHINHDLAVAVVETCGERRTTPDTPPVYQDCEKANGLLASVEVEVRADFEIQIVKVATRDAELLKHAVSSFSMAAARETAWLTAQSLWNGKSLNSLIYRGQETVIGKTVGGVSHGILLPVVPPAPGVTVPAPCAGAGAGGMVSLAACRLPAGSHGTDTAARSASR